MNLTDAIAAVLVEMGAPASSREIADRVWDQFEQFRNTDAQRSSKRYPEPIDALRASVATTVKKSRRFMQDRSGHTILVSLSDGSALWSDDELEASVTAYIEMRELALSQVPFVKKAYYSRLADTFKRTPSSYEFRMQNISAVLASQGRYWLPGLLPAKNVGSNVFSKIEAILFRLEGRGYEALAPSVGNVLPREPTGQRKPTSVQVATTRFARDPQVREWILINANGICEGCDAPAPFSGVAGPFLEVHHLRRLADGGPDTIDNALALCPNCHRRLHYALDAPRALEGIYAKISRLRRHSAG